MRFMNSLIKRYQSIPVPAKASIWFIICSIIQKSVYFILIPIYTRILNTDEYGIYSVFTSWVTLIATFAGLNLAGNSYNVGMVKYDKDQDRYTSTIQGLWWANTLLWFILGLIVSPLWVKYAKLPFSFLIAVFADVFATGAFDLWSSRQKFDYKYKSLVILTLLVAVITPLVSIPMVNAANNKAMAAVWCKVGVLGLFSLITAYINIKKGKSLFNKIYWKNALLFNIPLIAYYLSLTVLSHSDRIMISSICGNDDAGIYSIAYSLAMVLTMLNSAVNGAFIPWEFKKIKSSDTSSINKITNLILILVGAGNLILIAVAPEIIHLFTPAEYHSSVWVVPPVALSSFIMCLYQFFVNIEFYYEKNKFVMVASIIVAVLNIVLNMIFIPLFGFIAAAYTTLISYICFAVAHYFFMMKIFKENGEKTVYKPKQLLLISLVMFALSSLFLVLYKLVFIRYALIVIISMLSGYLLFSSKNRSTLLSLMKMK